MGDELEEEYPEAAPYIWSAVKRHGEEWVIKNYFPKITQLGVIMDIPDVEELPFYDEERHRHLTEQENHERAAAYREYRDNLRTGSKPERGE